MRPARHHGGTPGSPVGPLLASGSLLRRYQEPPEVFALRAALVLVSLPAGKARLRLQENLHRPKARVRRSHRTSETYKPWPPEPGFAPREAQVARWKLDHLGRLLKRMTNASACKEGVHGGTRGSPVQASEAKPTNKRAGSKPALSISNANQSAIRMRMGEVGECGIGLTGWSVIPRSRVPEMLPA